MLIAVTHGWARPSYHNHRFDDRLGAGDMVGPDLAGDVYTLDTVEQSGYTV